LARQLGLLISSDGNLEMGNRCCGQVPGKRSQFRDGTDIVVSVAVLTSTKSSAAFGYLDRVVAISQATALEDEKEQYLLED